MSFWRKLGMVGSVVAAPFTGGASLAALPMLAAGANAAAQGMANNRGEKFSGQIDLERVLMDREQQLQQQQIAREQEGRAGTTDAWRKLLSAQHVGTPGQRPQLAGPYNIAPRQATEKELYGADALTNEVMARLTGGNPIPQVTQHANVINPKLLDAGLLENILGVAGPVLGAASAFSNQRKPMDGIPVSTRTRGPM